MLRRIRRYVHLFSCGQGRDSLIVPSGSCSIRLRRVEMLERQQTEIRGVYRFPLRVHQDPRGALTEVFRQAWLSHTPKPMLQANLSFSKKGVIRGLHYHLHQADFWIPVRGVFRAGLVDLRKGSPTECQSLCVDLDDSNPCALYVPPGVAHGYQALTDAALMYLVDAYYDGSDEFGLKWDDPDLAVDWSGTVEPILSERDRRNPCLSEISEEKRPRY